MSDKKNTPCWIISFLAPLFLLADAAPLLAHEKWFVSFYGGIYSDTSLIENLYFKSAIENSYISVISLGRELSVYEEKIAVEIEGQLGFHYGAQNHQEMNCAIILRWLSFPWDHYVDTSFAIGNGISYATVAPVIEIENAVNGNTNQWLYYMMVEWAFTALSQWEFFWRIHHRSGIYGLMADDDAGSNFIGFGIRFRY
jgi:hypothetical protein